MDGEDLYLDIGEGVPKMQMVGSQLNASWNIVTFVKIQLTSPPKKDARETAFMTVWREEVVKKLGYGLRLPRSPTWEKAKD